PQNCRPCDSVNARNGRSLAAPMPRFVAFLRGINLGGVRTVRMDFLRHRFESLDFSSVETFIASGNVVFHARAKSSRALATKVDKSLRAALGYYVYAFIITPA